MFVCIFFYYFRDAGRPSSLPSGASRGALSLDAAAASPGLAQGVETSVSLFLLLFPRKGAVGKALSPTSKFYLSLVCIHELPRFFLQHGVNAAESSKGLSPREVFRCMNDDVFITNN